MLWTEHLAEKYLNINDIMWILYKKAFKKILYVNVFLNSVLWEEEKKTHYYSEEQKTSIFRISLFYLYCINERSIIFFLPRILEFGLYRKNGIFTVPKEDYEKGSRLEN